MIRVWSIKIGHVPILSLRIGAEVRTRKPDLIDLEHAALIAEAELDAVEREINRKWPQS
jgi:hypothetical protein